MAALKPLIATVKGQQIPSNTPGMTTHRDNAPWGTNPVYATLAPMATTIEVLSRRRRHMLDRARSLSETMTHRYARDKGEACGLYHAMQGMRECIRKIRADEANRIQDREI